MFRDELREDADTHLVEHPAPAGKIGAFPAAVNAFLKATFSMITAFTFFGLSRAFSSCRLTTVTFVCQMAEFTY